MKRIVSIFMVLIAFMFIGTLNVKALKVSISGPDKVEVGKTITLKFSVTDYNDSNTWKMSFDWDRNLLSWDCVSKDQGYTIPKSNPEFTCVFKGLKNGETVIKASTNYSGAGGEATHKVVVGTGTTSSSTTSSSSSSSSSSSTTTTTTTTSQLKSDNANLKSLKVTDKSGNELKYTPVFSSIVYEYSMDVESTIDAVDVDVTMEDEKSNVIISNNAKELVAGENNEVTITVTSESGIKKAYKLNIKRAAQDTSTSLSSLKIAEASDFTFDSTKYSYDVKVAKDVRSLTIDYSVSSDKAEVEIQGNSDLEDGSKVKILVTAEDGSKREYTINIIKEEKTKTTKKSTNTTEEKNPIIIMGLSIIAFALIGMIIYTIRKK